MSNNPEWINDKKLENDLKQYVAQNLKRKEMLDLSDMIFRNINGVLRL